MSLRLTFRSVVLAALLLVGFGGGLAPRETSFVEGTVLDGRTGHGLQGAVVTIKGRPRLRARTKANGEFRIENVPIGRQTVVARKNGFRSARKTIQVPGDGKTNFRMTLAPAGRLKGDVRAAQSRREYAAQAQGGLRSGNRRGNREDYAPIESNDFKGTSSNPLSTFSIPPRN